MSDSTINKIKVENMISNRSGSPVANQFIIITESGQYFQSYKTIIAYRSFGADSETILDSDSWDYSVTTLKYLKQFLGISYSKKEIQKMIDDGVYKLANLN